MTNRVAVNKILNVRRVNGPTLTIIQGRQLPNTKNGDGAIRCVYLTNGASISGFTLTNGATRRADDNPQVTGGAAWCETTNAVLSNCVLTASSASQAGGGVFSGSLYQCILTSNSASEGGGAYQSLLVD